MAEPAKDALDLSVFDEPESDGGEIASTQANELPSGGLDLSGFDEVVSEAAPAREPVSQEGAKNLDLSGFEAAMTPPEVPIETHPFVANTLADPLLTDSQRRTVVEEYAKTYAKSFGAETKAVDSFLLNFRDAWDNYNTLGAELRRKKIGGDPLLGRGTEERIEDRSRTAELIQAELARREAGGARRTMKWTSALTNILRQAISSDDKREEDLGRVYQAMTVPQLKGLLEDQNEQRQKLLKEGREKRYAGLLSEARKQAEFAALDSEGLAANAAAFAGQFAGAGLDPINAVPLSKAAQSASIPVRMAVRSGEAAAINALANPVLQASAKGANAQKEFEWGRFWADAGLGGGAGGAFEALGTVGRLVARRFGVDPSDVLRLQPKDAVKEISRKGGATEKEVAVALTEEAQDLAGKIEAPDAPGRAESPAAPPATPPPGMRQRQFSRRMEDDPNMDAAEIRANPEEYYTPQSNETGRQIVGQMPDAQLEDVFRNTGATTPSGENFSTMAGLELMRRRIARGQPIKEIREDISKRGTSVGQMLQQFSEWKTTSPEGLVTIVADTAAASGRTIAPEAAERGAGLARKRLEAMEKLREIEARHLDEFTDETEALYKAARKEAAEAARQFDDWGRDMAPPKFWRTLRDVMKLNLLTPESLQINVLGNLFLQPARKTRDVLANGLDFIIGLASGKRTRAMNIGTLTAGTRGALEGMKRSAEVLLRGGTADDYLKAELIRGFRPFRSMLQAFAPPEKARTMMPVKESGEVAWSDRARKLAEALLGAPAETIARLLQVGDKPFRYGAEFASRAELASLKGLKGAERKKFILHPDPVSAKVAEENGLAAVFMKDNWVSRAMGTGFRKLENIPVIGGPARFFATTQVPFTQFPTNFIAEAGEFVFPVIPIGRSLYYAGKRDQANAVEKLAKGLAGATMYAGAAYLWDKGLITPHIDFRDEKLKALSYEFEQPPGTVNLSALQRLISGSSPKFKVGDRTIQYEKLGIPGMVMHVESQMRWNRVKEQAQGQIVPDVQWWERAIPVKDLPNTLSYVSEATPLMGVSNFLGALVNRNWDRWLENLFTATSAVAVPNSVTAAFKTQYEYIPELTGKDAAETFRNVWNYKLHRLDTDHPVKVGLLGEKIPRTPPGKNPWVWHLLNPIDARKTTAKPVYQFIEQLYRKTADSAVIPGHPGEEFTDPRNGERMRMVKGGKEHELLMEYVGSARKQLINALRKDPGMLNYDNEAIVKSMRRIYDMGRQIGFARFLEDPSVDWSKIEKVPQPVGFEE